MAEDYKMLIGGEYVDAKEKFTVSDKHSGEAIGEFPIADEKIYSSAVETAQKGLEELSALPAHRRALILEKISQTIESRKEEFTRILCQETGKPHKFASGEVSRAVQTFKFASEVAKSIHGETVPLDAAVGSENRVGFYYREPCGIVGAITPFNYPLNLAAHKLAPSFAAGCSVVLKPASFTPLSSLRLAEVALEAGLPEKAVNLIYGPGGTVGEWLSKDERLAAVTFTGSPPVGRRIKELSGLKRVVLELGSNSAAIVEPDADLEFAVPRLVTGSFAYSGQVCISVQRIYLQKKIFESFLEGFIDKTRKLKIGPPRDETTDIGPMISEGEAKRVQSWIEEAVSGGAKVVTGGKREGVVCHPTVLTEAKPDMKVSSKEVFGPVVCVTPYDSFEEALRMVNDSTYGLQAGVFTRDVNKAFRAVKALKVGGVIINDYPTYRADNMPYGGVKESGLGREGLKFAVEELTDIKMVVFNL
jgi:acyl-CoA reductase-like NAD-dependent aldehyde dehydrogenase